MFEKHKCGDNNHTADCQRLKYREIYSTVGVVVVDVVVVGDAAALLYCDCKCLKYRETCSTVGADAAGFLYCDAPPSLLLIPQCLPFYSDHTPANGKRVKDKLTSTTATLRLVV